MDKFIAEVFESEFFWTRPQIAFFKKVASHHSIVSDQHPIDSDVKLSFVNQ